MRNGPDHNNDGGNPFASSEWKLPRHSSNDADDRTNPLLPDAASAKESKASPAGEEGLSADAAGGDRGGYGDGTATKKRQRKRSGKKTPFALVTFRDESTVERALEEEGDDDDDAASSSGAGDDLSAVGRPGGLRPRRPFANLARPQTLEPLPPKAAERRRKRETALAEEEGLAALERRFPPVSMLSQWNGRITVMAVRCPTLHAAQMERYLLEAGGPYADCVVLGTAQKQRV